MTDDSAPETDLLGDPWTQPRDRRGRKPHRRIPQIAEKIAVLRATGAKVEEVERIIGLSEKTLRKYYSRELGDDGRLLARSAVTQVMWRKAMDGNVAAAKFIAAELAKGDAEAFANPAQKTEPEANRVRLGKKEAAAQAAQTAGLDTGWGDDLVPTVN